MSNLEGTGQSPSISDQWDNFKKEVANSQVAAEIVLLSDLKLVGDNYISFKGKMFKLPSTARTGLLKILGLTQKAVKSIVDGVGSKATSALLGEMQKRMTAAKRVNVRFEVDFKSNEVVSISDSEKKSLPHNQFLDIVEGVIGDKNLEIQHLVNRGGQLTVNCRSNHNLDFPGMKNESHNIGYSFRNLHHKTDISAFLFRWWCANGMIAGKSDMTEPIELTQLTPLQIQNFQSAVKELQTSRLIDLKKFQDKVGMMMDTPASYAEVAAIQSLVRSKVRGLGGSDDGDAAINRALENHFPLANVDAAYFEKFGSTVANQSKQFQKNVIVPMSTWKLYNRLTSIASHDPKKTGLILSDASKTQLMTRAGSFLTSHTMDMLQHPGQQLFGFRGRDMGKE